MWGFPLSVSGAAELAAPQNVTMVTLNTNYMLSWDWDPSAAGSHGVTFTTQYVGKFKLKYKSPKWSMVCENTPQTSCDLTDLNLHYLGIYVFRVRASADGRHSDWVLKEFCPDKDAAVGPPSKVELSVAEGFLEISISDPLTNTNTSMKDKLRELYYHIVYWEGSPGIQTLDSKKTLVTLSNLKSWTWYCVMVQSRSDFYNKTSSFTSPQCMQTTESELLCDKVIICPAPVLEIHNPPPEVLQASMSSLEPDSSGRHSRQDSSCSGDSGVYSAGGSSGLQQPSTAQSSTGIEASWRDPFDMDHVKMKDMAPGLKSQLLMADESIVDVCV
ncbi:Interferon alpha/beta receptor 1a [Collichthys lucidus]|uniref:Interferon alpha/beta receptor 1a n=1 Tax=Collichthys lucidus TaxID=240159 RepID=A0A4U5TYM9_COLLU|nr:Interferon alpha/beta receptor 1a [Collichthys lucidus]